MTQYIPKDALVAEIERRLGEYRTYPDYQIDSNYMELCDILSFINTLEVKEVYLEKEYKDFVEEDPVYNKLVNGIVGKAIAKHFFELGISASNPITATDRCTAEEIIINLKRIESDYRIDLTKEIEWLRKSSKETRKVRQKIYQRIMTQDSDGCLPSPCSL